MKNKRKIRVLLRPLITEKSLKLVEEQNQYTFLISDGATKEDVEKEVEKKFDVEVLKVRVINIKGKRISWGRKRLSGRKANKRKAIVTLDKSDTIDLFKVK